MLRYVFGKSLLLQFAEIFIMLRTARKIVVIREQYFLLLEDGWLVERLLWTHDIG
jgi:hypothetical protein